MRSRMRGVQRALCTIKARTVSGQYSRCAAMIVAANRAASPVAALVPQNAVSGSATKSALVVRTESDGIPATTSVPVG
jgi:hypothetical protein